MRESAAAARGGVLSQKKMEEILIYISRSLYVREVGGGGCELELIVSDFFPFGKRWKVAKIKRKKFWHLPSSSFSSSSSPNV